MRDRLHILGGPVRVKILIIVLSLALLGVVLCSYQAFRTVSRGRHPLPNRPIAIHHGDCIWIIDEDAAAVTHGPCCLSGLWTQVDIGDVEIAPNGHLYVSFPTESHFDRLWGKTVLELDPVAAREVDRIEVQIRPDHMVRTGNDLLYVSTGMVSTGVTTVIVIDMGTNTVVDDIILNLPCEPDAMVLGPNGELYVSACWSLARIDTTTHLVSYSPIEFRPSIYDMAVGSDGYLYLLLFNAIHIIDPSNWATIASIDEDSNLAACSGQHLIAMEGRAFVTCHATQSIVVYDVASNTFASIQLPDWYFEVAAASREKLYLVQRNGAEVLVLDVRSNQILTEIPLPESNR